MAKRFWIVWRKYENQEQWIYRRVQEYCAYRTAVDNERWNRVYLQY